ncbi:MAG: type II toxin-antitoxin system VapC family toxin [Pirellulaceae bacterium]
MIDAERGVADAVTFTLAQNASAGMQISAVSAMELIIGCRDGAELLVVKAFLARATIHEINSAISQQARDWVASFYLSHGLTIPDALIGATAHLLSLPLYTKNTRHFQMLPSLVVIRPY